MGGFPQPGFSGNWMYCAAYCLGGPLLPPAPPMNCYSKHLSSTSPHTFLLSLSLLPTTALRLTLPPLLLLPGFFCVLTLLSHSAVTPWFTEHPIVARLPVATGTEVGVLGSRSCQGKPMSLYHFLFRCTCSWLMIPWNQTSQVFPVTCPMAEA